MRESTLHDCVLRVSADPAGDSVRGEARIQAQYSFDLLQELFGAGIESQYAGGGSDGTRFDSLPGEAAEIQQRRENGV